MDFVDFHAHIIPHADHGSTSTDVSIMQLQLALKHGIKRIVATPHFYPHMESAEAFLNRRNACYKRLVERYTYDAPEVILGAEVLICDNIEQMPGLDTLCIEGTKAILLELPFTDFSDNYVYSVKELINQGYTVILAHADRYDPDNIDRLLSVGAHIQLNADALSKLFVPKRIKKWLSGGNVYAIGSDIHGVDKRAYTRFNRAISKLADSASSIKEHSDAIWNQRKK